NATPILTVERIGSAINAVIETKTSAGSVYFGNTNGSTFAIGATSGLSSPWVSVSNGNASISGNLTVGGTATFGNNVSVGGTLTVDTNAQVNGNADISGSLTVGGTATFKSAEYRRQAISSNDQPTEPQEFLSFVWEEGNQNLGVGE